ncbi:hypothetical protein [Paludisphaera mucosa]|uniref:Uncharacterized protein n=1 Tax=Paludisphaera mucosa TaxID=3030827 RepID=A0ABT6FG48_9BACT|nr:hypothetical protein [Paludisphaera mucosa]MDG3006545.1 hypothetical protein [Paludisphaera mucosa]
MNDAQDELKSDAAAGEPKPETAPFDFAAYPANSVFHERREGKERRGTFRSRGRFDGPDTPRPPKTIERRERKERRKRIDPTTFEKQYTDDEMEFMNAMQRFKELSGKSFPTYAEVIKVAVGLGYRKIVDDAAPPVFDEDASLLLFTKAEQDA